MNKFGNQPYELPTNTDLEKVLKKNLDNVKPVEIKQYEAGGKNMLFPFWTPVKDAEGVTFTDYKKYLSGKEKRLDIKAKKDQVGVVQPKDPSKTYEEDNIIDKIENIVSKHNGSVPFDNSGAVKVVKNAMDGTKTSKQVTDNRVGEPKEAKVEKSAKSKTGVGAVTPQADMGKQTSLDVTANSSTQKSTSTTKTQVTDNKVGEPKEVKVEKSAKSKTGVGAVKPQADMGKQTKVDVTAGSAGTQKSTKTKKQVTDNKVDKPKEATVERAGAKPATGVGAVKPQADMGKQNVGDLNFDKYKTNHIPKAKFESFIDSFKDQGHDDLIESVKTGFKACFEEFAPEGKLAPKEETKEFDE